MSKLDTATLKKNIPLYCMTLVAATLVTFFAIYHHQVWWRMLPLYISLIIGCLQSKGSRYASLIGTFNAMLYTVNDLTIGLYGSAASAFLFSVLLQFATFILWSKRKVGGSTKFRKMTWAQRGLVVLGSVALGAGIITVLKMINSGQAVLETITFLFGLLISVLTMFAFVEYTWLMIPSGIVSIVLRVAMLPTNPDQITYVVYLTHSLICVTMGFFSVRRLWREQQQNEKTEQ